MFAASLLLSFSSPETRAVQGEAIPIGEVGGGGMEWRLDG